MPVKFFIALLALVPFPLAAGPPPEKSVDVEIVDDHSAFSIAAARSTGISEAQRDIERRVFRIYEYGDWHPVVIRVDPQTGYRVQRVTEAYAYEKPSEAFSAWLNAYNQAMREWHQTHKHR